MASLLKQAITARRSSRGACSSGPLARTQHAWLLNGGVNRRVCDKLYGPSGYWRKKGPDIGQLDQSEGKPGRFRGRDSTPGD